MAEEDRELPFIYDYLNSNRLSRLLNFCSPKQKLSRLRFVDLRFHNACLSSAAWDSVNQLTVPQPLTNANTHTAIYLPTDNIYDQLVSEDDLESCIRLLELLTKVRSITLVRNTEHLHSSLAEQLVLSVKHRMKYLRQVNFQQQHLKHMDKTMLESVYQPTIDILRNRRRPVALKKLIVYRHWNNFPFDPNYVKYALNMPVIKLLEIHTNLSEPEWRDRKDPLLDKFLEKVVRELMIDIITAKGDVKADFTILPDVVNRLWPGSLKKMDLKIHDFDSKRGTISEIFEQFDDSRLSSCHTLHLQHQCKVKVQEMNTFDKIVDFMPILFKKMPKVREIVILLKTLVISFDKAFMDFMNLYSFMAVCWNETVKLDDRKQIVQIQVKGALEFKLSDLKFVAEQIQRYVRYDYPQSEFDVSISFGQKRFTIDILELQTDIQMNLNFPFDKKP